MTISLIGRFDIRILQLIRHIRYEKEIFDRPNR
jgi:hypothetical protein